MTKLRLVIFDCDGTLVDSQKTIVGCFQWAFENLGLDKPEPDAIRRTVGLSIMDGIGRMAPDSDDALRLQIVEGYREAFTRMRQRPDHEEPLYPGVVEVLDGLDAAGYLCGVATGKSLPGLKRTLELHGLLERFVTLQTADLNPGKPNPAMIEAALTQTGADVADTVMIGDTSFDIEMARNAGALAVGVSWGYHPVDELREAGAHGVIESFAELAPLLAHHMGD